MRPQDFPERIVTVPLNPNTRRPLTEWPKDKWEERVAWVIGHQRHPSPGIGIVTGPSDLLVLDLDRKKGKDGLRVILQYIESLKGKEAATQAITTHPLFEVSPTGGYHLYYRHPVGYQGRTTTSNRETGVDTRGVGGMVVCSPTPGYRWKRVDWSAIPDCPDWLLSWLEENQRTVVKRDASSSRVNSLPAGRLSVATELIAEGGGCGTAREILSSTKAARVRVHCPMHEDSRASAVLFRPEGRKRIFLYCSSCDRTWSVGRLQRKIPRANGD